MDSENIKNLNSILEGEYIAINSFDALIKHATDDNSKSELQKIQETHRQHASRISTEIHALGGDPPMSLGIEGMVSETISNIKHIGSTDNTSYLKEALHGEFMGINAVNELLVINTDSNTDQLLNTLLSEHQTNVNSLNALINTSSNVL